ncbi:flagellar filament capping protein FliD [Brevibacillus porteri]|uniref:Flagellar hook-associated protein 2 n=1 Tax=Brevibacillus porteri TaxID=2126350 RepID=A0ABX5FMV0_9BACL|nr:flagellar filament capping protein FliD [Brevibacillus porteri]MED1801461.1 flagellar filament capping protein FliD [Brevibacillus porteri]MED2133836.1 flagellar filament capping protein FliD [Brevibacillus porteri]MED2748242.1 flagellar filament capping protein FliD [Brevibacillus porteri]MED2815380.1 flagellar filament capping protein FliD [Brevibacillus porteri]MED2894813.1 flagellar filament capping protein FliD [Brevibacillus porteri]
MGIRITGMASGFDTEKMVKDLMKTQREPVNRLIRQKSLTEWKRDAYRDINAVMADLQNTVNSIRYTANFNKKIASSENDAIVSAKATGSPKSASYAIEVKQLAKAEMPAAVSLSVDSAITSSGQAIGSAFSFSIEGKTINVAATDTIDNVIQQIKGSGAGVEAQFIDNKLVIKSVSGNNLGGDNEFAVQVTAGDGSKLGMGSTPITSGKRIEGQSAIVVINGVEQTVTGNTAKFDGMEFTIKQTNVGNPLLVSTKEDVDSIFNSIKGFVDKYNAAIEVINKKISEPKYKGYQPLLDEEKEALDDKTAEKMEKMAKSGMLLRDPILTSALNEMRRSVSMPLSGTGVNSAFDTLSEIGIGGPPAGKNAYQENGKLYINEEKLRDAINNHGDDVIKLFTNYSSSSDSATKYKESGISERLFGNLTKVIKEVTKEAGSSSTAYDDSYLTRKIARTDEDIEQWEDRLKVIEDRYYKQFSAMEKAMSKSQSQGSWFAQMLGQR